MGVLCSHAWNAPLLSGNVYVPKDRVSNLHQGFGFVEFRSEEDADYVSAILHLPSER